MDFYNTYLKPYAVPFLAGTVVYYFASNAVGSVVNSLPVIGNLGITTQNAVTAGIITVAAVPIAGYAQSYI